MENRDVSLLKQKFHAMIKIIEASSTFVNVPIATLMAELKSVITEMDDFEYWEKSTIIAPHRYHRL